MDVVEVIKYMVEKRPESGLFNLGSGGGRTFIDTHLDIRDKYQYFTQADMTKLRGVGSRKPSHQSRREYPCMEVII